VISLAPSRPSRPARSSARRPSPLAEVWRARELLRNLVLRNLRIKYQRSFLGFVWTLLNPLLTIAVLVGVFGFVVRLGVPQYWAFLIAGYFLWSFASQTLFAATAVLPEHAHLARSVPFPVEVLVLAAALSRLTEFLAELTLTVLLLAAFLHHGVPVSFLWLPVLVLVTLILVVGLSLPIATFSALFHDVQHTVPIALMILFYASPVFYPASMVPAAARPFYLLNPFAGLLTLARSVLYEGKAPDLGLLAWTAAASILIAWFGYAIFRRYRPVLAEIV
jgi:lipopolysaccharide transport system permease protein